MRNRVLFLLFFLLLSIVPTSIPSVQKPVLDGKNWMAITGKSLAATVGTMAF
ncbi:hypothetical protein [Adhaeribacter arboris]|uniref:hypothetical protein n=1 Tax=Adhaeribacter arboris TaxID=2072846 RepID=UPI001304AD48|nr:hypothetical protein [Adhaeribacter arboris]